jgi:DNA polymerase elongation subunit (family B)
MIVNKQQIINPDTKVLEKLVVSYVNKNGGIDTMDYPIQPYDKFKWISTPRRNGRCDPEWRAFNGDYVYQVATGENYLPEYRINEILMRITEQYPQWNCLFDYNLPETWFCDIETMVDEDGVNPEAAQQPVNTIALTKFPRTIVWGRKPLTDLEIQNIQERISTHENAIVRKYKFEYKYFPNEADMLDDFFHFIYPIPAITGWNFTGFDWQYLYHRSVDKLHMDIRFLSPLNGQFYNMRFQNKFGSANVMVPYHKIIYDYMMVFSKWDRAAKGMENLSLDFVSETLLGYKKVVHSMGFNEFFEKDFPGYVFYNAIDTILVEQIDKKMHSSNIWYSLVSELKCDLNQMFKTVEPTEIVCVDFLYPRKQVIPSNDKSGEKGEGYEGAFVWKTQPGIFKFVGGLDFASLYPTTMRQFNMSPETFIRRLSPAEAATYRPQPNEIITKSGSLFRKDREGLIPAILTKFFMGRKQSKNIRKDVDTEVEILEEIMKRRFGS